jgi:predicted flap endonuclease-1-like 5' DNA nuclease
MYVLSQIWMFMGLAAMIGFAAGWWFGRCRCEAADLIAERDQTRARLAARDRRPMPAPFTPTPPAPAAPAAPVSTFSGTPARVDAKQASNAAFTPSALADMTADDLEAAVLAAGAGERPLALLGPVNGKPDDLKEIGGVGPTNEAWLHEHGIYHFWQIATMQAPAVAWLANNLPTFGKRVYRENWIDQAMRLARGEITDAKRNYDEGKHS